MKKFKILYLLFPLFLFSCEDWLDVTPSDQISEKELFKTSEGYRTSLLGVYRDISTPGLYAKEMTWGLMDVLAQYYDLSYSNNYAYRFSIYDDKYTFDYARTKPIINNLWSKPYNAIANCNNILNNIKNATSDMFKDGYGRLEMNMIRGEAYALRAFLHFDLLRVFAPSPLVEPNGKYIPYCSKFPSVVNDKIEVNTVLDSVISDLKRAERYTIEYDTLYKGPMSDPSRRLEGTKFGLSDFLSYRGYRMNYYAIKALKARAYLYKGDKENALKEASYLKEQKMFRFTSSYYIGRGETKMYDDVLFALYNKHLFEYYEQENYSEGYYDCYLAIRAEDMFDVNLDDEYDSEKDYRYSKSIEKRPGEFFMGKKYPSNSERYGEYNKDMIPLIRYSEVLLIYAECMYDTDPEKAKEALYTIRYNRGSKDDIDISSKEKFMNEIKLEYQREFIGEGQLFFYYKRLNKNIITGGKEIDMKNNFVIPIPEIESFNN